MMWFAYRDVIVESTFLANIDQGTPALGEAVCAKVNTKTLKAS